jgi:hypothetical protein
MAEKREVAKSGRDVHPYYTARRNRRILRIAYICREVYE